MEVKLYQSDQGRLPFIAVTVIAVIDIKKYTIKFITNIFLLVQGFAVKLMALPIAVYYPAEKIQLIIDQFTPYSTSFRTITLKNIFVPNTGRYRRWRTGKWKCILRT